MGARCLAYRFLGEHEPLLGLVAEPVPEHLPEAFRQGHQALPIALADNPHVLATPSTLRTSLTRIAIPWKEGVHALGPADPPNGRPLTSSPLGGSSNNNA
jgi:hypothetical protein